MIALDRFYKTPEERLDYDVSFDAFLPEEDSIATADAEAEGGTVEVDEIEHETAAVKVWVAGGAVGDRSKVTVTIVTDQGRTKQYAFEVVIKEL